MIPKHLHYIKLLPANTLTWEERVLVKRTKRLLPNWSYTLWQDECVLAVVQKHLEPLFVEKFLQIEIATVKTDIARYAILFDQGGVYLDTDYKLLKAPIKYLDASCLLPIEVAATEPSDSILGTAVLASIPGYSFWRDLLIHLLSNVTIEELNHGDPVQTTGPLALTSFWRSHHGRYHGIKLPAQAEFHPALAGYNFSFDGTVQTHGVHLCWGSWRDKRSIQRYKNLIRRKVTCML